MSDEYNDDLESSEQAPTETPVPTGLPDWAKEQVAQANREAQGLRKRLKERETEILTSKYEAVIDLLPDEVTGYDAKLAFLEKAQARFASTVNATEPTEIVEPVSDAQEAPTETEQKLAAVSKGPSGAPSGTLGLSDQDILQLAFSDPARYQQLRDSGAIPAPSRLGPDK